MKKLVCLMLLGLVAVTSMPATTAQASGWQRLATRSLNGRTGREDVSVNGNRRHRQLRLCAARNPVRILRLDVVLENGRRQNVRLRQVLDSSECTHALNIAGNGRNIRTILLDYRRMNFGVAPRVTFYAR